MGPYHPHSLNVQPRRTENKAVVSLILGVASMGCVGPLFGLPAIILGAMARRDIDRSNGTLGGRAVAAGGIVSGLFGTGLGVVIALSIVGAAFSPDSTGKENEEPTATGTVPAVATPVADPPPASTAPGVHFYGPLEVVDVDNARPLKTQLIEVVRQSRGRTVVLQTYVKSSSACQAVAAALPDKRMQLALANVTLVRVDVDEYDRELRQMRVETASAPWFYTLDAKADTKGALSAAAWEAHAPENMAPLLGRFVHPEPKRR